MRAKFAVATGLSLLLFVPSAEACQDLSRCDLSKEVQDSQEFREFLTQWRAKRRAAAPVPPRQIRTWMRPAPKVVPPPAPETRIVTAPPAVRGVAVAPATTTKVAVLPPPPPPTESLKFFLRQSFDDINLFLAPIPNAKAKGAEFSWTTDRISKDDTWSGKGVAALAYSYLVEDIRNPFIGATIAGIFKFNREIHSRLVENNIDAKTIGVSGEIGYMNAIFEGGDYLRFTGAASRDEILDRTLAHAQVEWLPTYFWIPGTIGGVVRYNFMPELKAQYDSTDQRGKVMAFSGRPESFRVGPEVTVLFEVSPDSNVPEFFKGLSAAVTYHWWTETYSGRTDHWLDASITQNLDPDGYVALKFAYNHGRSETTGAKTDIFKISLTAKLCAELIAKDQCQRPPQ